MLHADGQNIVSEQPSLINGSLGIYMANFSVMLAGVHLLTPAHQTGTHFLPTSETIVFLSQLSNTTLRPFSSR